MAYLLANAADGSQNNKEPECFALLHNFLMMHSAEFTLSSGCDVKSSRCPPFSRKLNIAERPPQRGSGHGRSAGLFILPHLTVNVK